MIKGRVQYFSVQVVMNKCFFLVLKKKLAQICLVIFEKNAKSTHFNFKSDVTDPKARLL